MTWAESVDEALCFGWIDGRANSIDDESYDDPVHAAAEAEHLEQPQRRAGRGARGEGRMRDAGRRRSRLAARSDGVYSAERQEAAKLEPEQEKRFRAEPPRGSSSTRSRRVTGAPRSIWSSARRGPRLASAGSSRLIADSAAGLPAQSSSVRRRGRAERAVGPKRLRSRCLAPERRRRGVRLRARDVRLQGRRQDLRAERVGGAAARISLKAEPEIAADLRSSYESIVPGYHLNKRHSDHRRLRRLGPGPSSSTN